MDFQDWASVSTCFMKKFSVHAQAWEWAFWKHSGAQWVCVDVYSALPILWANNQEGLSHVDISFLFCCNGKTMRDQTENYGNTQCCQKHVGLSWMLIPTWNVLNSLDSSSPGNGWTGEFILTVVQSGAFRVTAEIPESFSSRVIIKIMIWNKSSLWFLTIISFVIAKK